MTWTKLSEVKIRNRDGNFEIFTIQSNGDFYRIQNDFGNVSFEFDVSSGYELVEELGSIITNEINQQVNTFMNQEDALLDISGTSDEVTTEFTSGDNDYSPSIQLDLFNNSQTASR
jgi:hypothetical protein